MVCHPRCAALDTQTGRVPRNSMKTSPREHAVDQQTGILSIVLAPVGLLIILLWL
jgi:hypothetical protein